MSPYIVAPRAFFCWLLATLSMVLHVTGHAKPIIPFQPQSVSVLVGSNATLNFTAGGIPPFSYQWRKNGRNISDATNSTLTIPAAQFSDEGIYDAVVSDADGTNATFPRQLFVSQGTVSAWGNNDYGQLKIPPSATNIIGIAAGNVHAAALRADQTVIAWGYGASGATNVPPFLDHVVQIAAGGLHTLALKSDGTVVGWGTTLYAMPTNLNNVVAVAAGEHHSLALLADGTVVAWGLDYAGQIDVPPVLANVVAIAAGQNHSLALTADGTVTAWGANDGGQSAVPASLSNVIAIASGPSARFSLALQRDGTIVGWGTNTSGQLTPPAGLIPASFIAANFNNTLAVTTNGAVAAWGSNSDAQTNVPAVLFNTAQVAAGGQFSLALGGSGVAPIILSNPTNLLLGVGGTATFKVAASGIPLAYQWYFNSNRLANAGRTSGATTDTLVITNVQEGDTGAYYVIASNFLGVAISATPTLIVTKKPAFTLQPASQTNTAGLNATVTALAIGEQPLSYQWYFNGAPLTNGQGISGVTSNTLSFTAPGISRSGIYSLVASNSAGTTASLDADIEFVGVPATIASQPASLSAFLSSTVTFSTTVTGSPPFVVQWFHNANPVANDARTSGANSSTLTISNLMADDDGIYEVVAFNIFGGTTSIGADLNVYLPPVILQDLTNQTVRSGSNTVLTVSAAPGNPPATYSWLFNGSHIAPNGRIFGLTSNALSINGVQLGDSGTYTVVVSNLAGAVTSSAALTVAQPPSITQQPIGQSAPPLTLVTFTTVAIGTPLLVYQWYFKGAPITDATNSSYTIPSATDVNYGGYFLTVTNTYGAVTSAIVQLTASDIVPWGTSGSNQIRLPAGLTNVIAVSARGENNLALRNDGTVIAWSTNLSAQTNAPATATNIVAIAAGGGHYLALRADGRVLAWGRNEFGQANVPFTLSNVVAIAAGERHSAALGNDGRVTGWGDNASYAEGFTNAFRIASIGAGSYQTMGVRADGRIFSSGFVSVYGTYPYSGGTNVPGNLTGIGSVAGGLWHAAGLCTNGTVVVWGTTNDPLLAIPPDLTNATAVVAGDYFNVALRANGTVAAWGRNESGQTNVPAGLTNVVAIAAGSTHGLALIHSGKPAIPQQPIGAGTQLGRRYVFSAVAVGDAPLFYQWIFNGTNNIPGATNATLILPSITFSNRGNYQVVVKNSLGTTVSTPAFLDVLSQPPGLATLPVYVVSYAGHSLWLDAIVYGNFPIAYQWKFNGTNIPGATNEDLIIPSLQTSDGGQYTVVISNKPPGSGFIASQTTTQLVTQLRMVGYQASQPPFLVTNAIATSAGYAGIGVSPAWHWILGSDHNLTGWGTSTTGEQLVPLSLTNNVIAIDSGLMYSLALRSDGIPVAWGVNTFGQPNVPLAANNVVAIAAGDAHAMALRSDGAVIVWGNNQFGQLNLPAGLSNIVAIAVGSQHCLALRSDGRVIAWGQTFGLLPSSLTNIIAIAAGAGATTSAALRADGHVIFWGQTTNSIPTDWTNIVAISSGYQHVTALRADGTVATAGTFPGTPLFQVNLENVVALDSSGTRDLVTFGYAKPTITVQPFSRSVFQGTSNVLFASKAVSPFPVSYQWYLNGQPLTGATNDNFLIPKAQFTNAGAYQFTASNRLGLTFSKAATLTVTLPLDNALDTLNPNNAPYFTWSSTGAAAWFGETNVTHDGVDAAQSGAIGPLQETVLATQTNLTSTGKISFWWKVSSEAGFDALEFRVNGTVMASISGEVDWQQQIIPLTATTNLLQWRYSKDFSGNIGADAGWVDQVAFIPDPPVINRQPANQTVNVSNAASFTVSVSGAGPLVLTWFHNGTDVVGAGPTMTLVNATRSMQGAYACTVTGAGGSVTSSNATLIVRVPQKFGAAQIAGNGTVSFVAGDVDGGLLYTSNLSHFTLQGTTNFTNWVTLTNTLTLTNGMLKFSDPGQTNFTRRFYRILEQ